MKKTILLFFLCCNFSLFALDISFSGNFTDEFDSEFTQTKVADPLENYNRFMHKVNWKIYDYTLSPALNTYNTAMPLGYRLGIENFFNNLASPLRFAVNLLSFEFKDAMDELGRFTLNSTAGILGIFDIASQNGLYTNKEDFGILFGKWGMGDGFYLVLPLLGPSTLRDTLGIPLNTLAYPTTYLDSDILAISSGTLRAFNSLAENKDALDAIRKDTLDDYIFTRDAYLQHRLKLIKGNE